MAFRPALRPGAPLLRRGPHTLQVGVDPGITFGDKPGLFALLRLIDGSRTVERLADIARVRVPVFVDDLSAVLQQLLALGIVVDASAWSGPNWRGLTAEARHLASTGQDPTRLQGRPGFRVSISHDPATAAIADAAKQLLIASGIAEVEATTADLSVVLSSSEPPRSLFDTLMDHCVAHLPVVAAEDRVRLGPLVIPGRTPCLSCLDLYRAEWDLSWPAMLPQLERGSAGVMPPALNALAETAVALEMAAEVLAVCDGRAPRTVGQCLTVGPAFDERSTSVSPFHPLCSCSLLMVT